MLKGLFSHIFAKAVFVACTYLIHLYLGKTLTAAAYGTIGVVISIITINYNFLSNGVRQAASKLLASQKYDEKDLIKKSVIIQMVVAAILTSLNYFGANYLAEFLNAPQMGDYIKLAALMIPFTAGYFVCIGSINGLRLFVVEAFIVTVYPLLRLTVIPYVRYIFNDSAVGTVNGFFTAAAICCMGSILFLYFRRKQLIVRFHKVEIKVFVSHITSFLLFFTAITVILNVDMLFVNALILDANQVGYYTGAVNFAKVSYYLLSAVYIVTLPMITKYYVSGNVKMAREMIRALNDTIALLILPIVSIVGATSSTMLSVFYKPEYASASLATAILMCSQFFIGLFVVINMCISATQNKQFSTILVIIVTLSDIFMCYVFIQLWGIVGAAVASLCASATGCVISYIKAARIFGGFISDALVKLIIGNVLMFLILKQLFIYISITNLFVMFLVYALIYFLFVSIMVLTKQVDIKNILKTLLYETT